MNNSRIGTILVDMEFFASLLHLPEDHTVVDVRRIDNTPFRRFEVLCAGPTLPEIADGADVPVVRYEVTQTETEAVRRELKFEGKFST